MRSRSLLTLTVTVVALVLLVPTSRASFSPCSVTARSPYPYKSDLVAGRGRFTTGCTGRFTHVGIHVQTKTRAGVISHLRCRSVLIGDATIRCRTGVVCSSRLKYRSKLTAYRATEILDSDVSLWRKLCY